MRTILVAGMALCLSLLSTGCNILDDQVPAVAAEGVPVKIFASVSATSEGAGFLTRQLKEGDLYCSQSERISPQFPNLTCTEGGFTGRVSNLRLSSGNLGLPAAVPTDELNLYHWANGPGRWPARLLGEANLPTGDYLCISGVLQADGFTYADHPVVDNEGNPLPGQWVIYSCGANQAIPFGPICFRQDGVGLHSLSVTSGEEARAWVDLAVSVQCDEDGATDGQVTLLPGDSSFGVEVFNPAQ